MGRRIGLRASLYLINNGMLGQIYHVFYFGLVLGLNSSPWGAASAFGLKRTVPMGNPVPPRKEPDVGGGGGARRAQEPSATE